MLIMLQCDLKQTAGDDVINPSDVLVPELHQLRSHFRAAGRDLRLVGGCVRDLLGGQVPKDVDLHTDATPDECVQLYEQHQIRWEATGIDHGTITVIFDHVGYEITSLRQDVATDGRRAVVNYTRDWKVDLERRDFTINSISSSFEGELLDPFGGKADLVQGVVRFVGDAEQRIREDYLRILRWFRFSARFGKCDLAGDLMLDSVGSLAVTQLASGLAQISMERVWSEFGKILSGPHAINTVKMMRDHHVDRHIGIDRGFGVDWSLCRGHVVRSQSSNPVTVLTALLGWHAHRTLRTWRASNDEIKLSEWLMQSRGRDPFWMMAVEEASRAWAQELAKFDDADQFCQALLESWPVPQFPVTGYDLIKLGVKPGPNYKAILNHLRNRWGSSGYTFSKDQLLTNLNLSHFD
jgi:hypothetical protein